MTKDAAIYTRYPRKTHTSFLVGPPGPPISPHPTAVGTKTEICEDASRGPAPSLMHLGTLRAALNFRVHAFLDERPKGKYCLHREAADRIIIDWRAATE